MESDSVRALRRRLLAHYDATRRDLPWRGETDPYRIWVSEVMLQQTRVETVVPYYRRWLELFPDVEALAGADLDEVLLAWQGLGYYRRARALHAGAAVVRERLGGFLPRSAEALRALPGVGEYTAGAVASIAFGEAVGAVDGNVKRVFARLFDEPSPTPAWLRDTADGLVDPARPGDWNQAVMELGATVCTPRSPRCDRCPVEELCAARQAGTQDDRPVRGARREVRASALATAVVLDGSGRGLVVRRPDDGLLGGLWAFPDAEVAVGGSRTRNAGCVRKGARDAAERAGAAVDADAGRLVAPVRHRFTHLAATYHPVLLEGRVAEAEDRRWIALEGPWPVALPVAQQKIARAACTALEGTPIGNG